MYILYTVFLAGESPNIKGWPEPYLYTFRYYTVRYTVYTPYITGRGGGRIYVPYFPYQKSIGIIRRIYAVFPYIYAVFPWNSTVQNRISICTPDSGSNPSRNSPFALWVHFSFATPLIKHSLCFPLCFNARFCMNHNVLLVVRVVGLLFALEMAILGVLLALDRPNPSNIDFLAQLN